VEVNWHIYTKAIATLASTKGTRTGLMIINIELLNIERKTRGHWLKGVVVAGLPQNNLWNGMSGKKVVVQFAKLKSR
jgi:hypothetical protein